MDNKLYKLPFTAEEVKKILVKQSHDLVTGVEVIDNLIKVTVNFTISDGSEIKFLAPVDCSKVTRLLVCYPDSSGVAESKEFIFADANGNDLGDIDHLFAANAMVKVLLTATTGKAFVQNADTNAYLESRFAQMADELVAKKQSPTDEGKALVIDSQGNVVPGMIESGIATETDPTVPAWAKASTKPEYSAAEIKDIVGKNVGKNSEIFNNYAKNAATGSYAHAEGHSTEAAGSYTHAEGYLSKALTNYSHAEGYGSVVGGKLTEKNGVLGYNTGTIAHAEGRYTEAHGNNSHAEGNSTMAVGDTSHVQGKYNIPDVAMDANGNWLDEEGNITTDITKAKFKNTYAHIVGNGSASNRSNAHTLDWKGNAWFAGDVFVGPDNDRLARISTVHLEEASLDSLTQNGCYFIDIVYDPYYNQYHELAEDVGVRIIVLNDSQFMPSTYDSGSWLCRHKDGLGHWGEWEWINPPLHQGYEYRTTERYNGHPVFIKKTFETWTYENNTIALKYCDEKYRATPIEIIPSYGIVEPGLERRTEIGKPPIIDSYWAKSGDYKGNAGNYIYFKTGSFADYNMYSWENDDGEVCYENVYLSATIKYLKLEEYDDGPY